MNIIDKLENQLEIGVLKYLIGKQIFCPVSNKALDFRHAIMITTKKDNDSRSRVLHGDYALKVRELKDHFEAKGFEVEIFINVKD